MPVTVLSDSLPVSYDEIALLWTSTQEQLNIADDDINVQTVSAKEIQKLNKQYRQKDKPTNVLTFTYDGEHDVALCEDIAKEEAEQHGVSFRDYTAWLLAHAFVHAAGVDHEKSRDEEERMKDLEKKILKKSGFTRPDIY